MTAYVTAYVTVYVTVYVTAYVTYLLYVVYVQGLFNLSKVIITHLLAPLS